MAEEEYEEPYQDEALSDSPDHNQDSHYADKP